MALFVFLIVFVGVVLVHELGHYVFAKTFNVQVLEFAIGFGPALWRKRGRETTFRINAFPFGGYVKLAGENPYEEGEWEEGKGFYDKPAYQRLLIALAGPVFSILAGYFLFILIVNIWGVNFSGVSQVIPDSPAQRAGLMKGDLILKVNGEYVFDPSVISRIIRRGEEIELTVLREGEKKILRITPHLIPAEVDFLLSSATGTVDGDFISVEGIENPRPEDLKDLLKSRIEIVFSRSSLEGVLEDFGYVPERYAIGFVFSGLSPIFRKDIGPFEKGDRIISIDKMNINGWLDFIRAGRYVSMKENDAYVEILGKKVDWWSYGAGEDVKVVIERGGKRKELVVKRKELEKIISDPASFEPEVKPYKPKDLFERLEVSIARCNWILILTWDTIFRRGFFRSVASGEVAGPVGIAKMVGVATELGMDSVLSFVAILTINLGLFNLLPLPALDGGRIVFALVEMITRKKLDPKIEAMIHTIGFMILMGLLVYLTFIDIGRFAG